MPSRRSDDKDFEVIDKVQIKYERYRHLAV